MILITGVNGYLGHLIYKSLTQNFDIYGASRKKNRYTDFLIDFNNPNFNLKKFKRLKIHTIIHLVSLNQNDAEKNKDKSKIISEIGIVKLLEFASKIGVKRIIYFSSSQIYGKNLKGIVNEKTIPKPVNNYSKTHFKVENICKNFSNKFKNGIIILRLSNIIGSPNRKKKQLWKLVCNDLCYQAVKNKKIILQSSGKQYRDFVSIYSLIEVLEKIIVSKDFKNKNYIFNMGSSKSISIIQLAKLIQNRCKLIFKYKPKLLTKKNKIEVFSKYIYQNNKLTKYKINFTSNHILQSIDETLKYCLKYKSN